MEREGGMGGCVKCVIPPILLFIMFSRVHTTLHPVLSVGRSVGLLVGHILLFYVFFVFGPHCSRPNGLVTSNMAPAHPYTTSVTVYPALFFYILT